MSMLKSRCLKLKMSMIFFDSSSIHTLPCEFANHRAGSQLKTRILITRLNCPSTIGVKSHFVPKKVSQYLAPTTLSRIKSTVLFYHFVAMIEESSALRSNSIVFLHLLLARNFLHSLWTFHAISCFLYKILFSLLKSITTSEWNIFFVWLNP